jgi:hypothetical protein
MLPIGEVKETDNPVAPAAARVARAGIGGFPVETPEQRATAPRRSSRCCKRKPRRTRRSRTTNRTSVKSRARSRAPRHASTGAGTGTSTGF